MRLNLILMMTTTSRLLLFYLSLLMVLVGLWAKSFVVAKEDERLVILSLGKLVGVYGPGLSIVIPFLDRVIRIKVETIVGWRELSETELRERATQIAIQSVSELN